MSVPEYTLVAGLTEEIDKARTELNELNKLMYEHEKSAAEFRRIGDDIHSELYKSNKIKDTFTRCISINNNECACQTTSVQYTRMENLFEGADSDLCYLKKNVTERIEYLENYIKELEDKRATLLKVVY